MTAVFPFFVLIYLFCLLILPAFRAIIDCLGFFWVERLLKIKFEWGSSGVKYYTVLKCTTWPARPEKKGLSSFSLFFSQSLQEMWVMKKKMLEKKTNSAIF